MKRDTTYELTENAANCLRAMAYDFLQAIDEIIARSQHGAETDSELGPEVMAFWESRTNLSAALQDARLDDDLF